MHIARIEQTRHRVPLEKNYQPVWEKAPKDHMDVDLVWVETDEGHVGVGPGSLPPGFEAFQDLFIGKDPAALEEHTQVIESLSFHYGPCWALDVALWDLAGIIHGQPVWQLLGAQTPRLRAFASIGTLRSPEDLAGLAGELVKDGFPAIKLRLWDRDWGADLTRMEAVREAAPDAILLAHCGQGAPLPWRLGPPRSPEDSLAFLRKLDELGVLWVEDPLHRADYKGLAGLSAATGLQVAGGAEVRDLHELRNLIVRAGINVLRTDASRMGGLTGLLPYLRRGKTKGLMYSPSNSGNGFTLLTNAHLAAASGMCPCFEFPLDPPHFTPAMRDYLFDTPVLPDETGWLELSDKPGFGFPADRTKLKDTQIGSDVTLPLAKAS